MTERILDLLKPVLQFVPQIRKTRGEQFSYKAMNTVFALFIYLICSQIPLFGIYRTSGNDPFYWMRSILASNRGTLMELGISPLITSNMTVQMITNMRIIHYDPQVKEDRVLVQKAEKLISILFSFGTSFVYVYSGIYGELHYIGIARSVLLVVQLTMSCVLIIYLDELLEIGHGLKSGVSLFIAVNICEFIFWKTFSPITFKTEKGVEFEGVVIAFFHILISKQNFIYALKYILFRVRLTNLVNLVMTILVFLVVIYLQEFKVNLKLVNDGYRGVAQDFPIKLFYLSNTPIILQTAFVSNIRVVSEILHFRFQKFYLVRLFGNWKQLPGGENKLVGGLCYYLDPPERLADLLYRPFESLVYIAIFLSICSLFALQYLEISGQSPKDILRYFIQNKMKIKGQQERGMIAVLKKHINTATLLGAISIGLLTIFSDLVGVIGSGTGILITVNVIYDLFKKIKDEKNKSALSSLVY